MVRFLCAKYLVMVVESATNIPNELLEILLDQKQLILGKQKGNAPTDLWQNRWGLYKMFPATGALGH